MTQPAAPASAADPSPKAAPPASRWGAIVVVIALALRLFLSHQRPVTATTLAALPDQREYLESAQRWLAGSGFSFYEPDFDQTLYAYRMPGYPLLIALCHAEPAAVQRLQALLDGMSTLAVYLVARRLAGEGVARAASLLVAFNPYLAFFSTLLLSETLFTAMLAWGVWGLTQRRVRWRAVGVGLLLASVYVRPSAAGLGVVAAGVAFATGDRWPRRCFTGGVAVLVACVCLYLILRPWALRNEREVNARVWLTTNDGFSAYDAFNPAADGSSDQRAIRRELTDDTLTEVGRSHYLSALAWDYARGHPARLLSLAAAKLGRFWSPVPLSADFGGKRLYVVTGGLYCVPLFALAAVGVVRGGLGKRAALMLLLPALYFTAVHSLAVGSLRYRVPCDVPLAVLAAAGGVSFVRPKAAA